MYKNSSNLIQYDISDGRPLYYSPKSVKFWLDEKPNDIIFELKDTTLSRLRIEISHLCNGNCRYCIVFGNKVENLNILDIRNIWPKIAAEDWFKKIREIFIIGGEPFLHYQEISFILQNFEGKVFISTNGTLITPHVAKDLSKYDVEVFVSLDGYGEFENYNRRYRSDMPMYNDILKGIMNLKNAGVFVGIFMVATPQNVNRITEVILEMKKTIVPQEIGYSLPHWTIHSQTIVTAQEYSRALMQLYNNRHEINIPILQLSWRIRPLIDGQAKKFSCGLHTTQKTLLPNGELVRCLKIDKDNNLKNVSDDFLDESCPLKLAERQSLSCGSCIALGCCGGGCTFDGLKRFNETIDRRECEIIPPLIEKVINDIIESLRTRYNYLSGRLTNEILKDIIGL